MDFRPLTFDDKPLIDAALAAHPPEISELTFTNFWVWRRKRAVAIARDAAGALALLCEEHGERFFLPPVGGSDLAASARELRAHARAGGFPFSMRRVPAAAARVLAATGLSAAPDRANFDYVHAVRDIAELAGRHFDGKRNQIRRLTEARVCVFEHLDEATVAECLALEEQWCDLRTCHLDQDLAAEQEAIAACLRLRRELGVFGGIVRVDGRLKAFALAERLRPDTAVVHFEKADPSVTGIYQLINHWFCREALGDFTFVNREQDLGLPGLRRAKSGWRPHHLVEKWTLTEPPPGAGPP
ncbi:MAG TPA: phosphatidylglycerol lysyltransferase domain-containing protein [bacterium]